MKVRAFPDILIVVLALWQHMYSHEVLHFLSGVVGSMLGCWIYFAVQRRKKID
jgi:membrane protein DedA with SNARE-associated domain